MITKRHLITAVLATFCLTTLLFMIVPTRSQTTLEYDPWKDINDDGKLDILDIVLISSQYGATGTPINKTALLLNLLAKIESLNATVIELQNSVSYLNNTVTYLNDTRGLGTPDYDSGWIESHSRQTHYITHNLNTPASELLVYVLGRYLYDGVQWRFHQYHYGSDEYFTPTGEHYVHGITWDSTNNDEIRVNNAALTEDTNAYQSVRVMIWKIPQP